MKSLLRLLKAVLADAETWCSASTTRDLETITRRTKHEGLSFLMITLPTFSQEFERALDESRIAPAMFKSFSKHRALPRFLGGLLERVFDRSTGVLLDNPCLDSIFYIRQVSLTCKKIEEPCSPSRMSKAFSNFIETNASCRTWTESLLTNLYGYSKDDHPDPSVRAEIESKLFSLKEVSSYLFHYACREDFYLPDELMPKHGPGATAEKISGNGKYHLRTWHSRLDEKFPMDLFCIPNWDYASNLEDISVLAPGDETPVRVVSVPKTLKAPRIIAVEPVCMQYTQQAVLEILVPKLESAMFNDSIGFTDQLPNQVLAQKSSMDGSLATIDLKDASDRVPASLVWILFEKFPYFREVIFSCRSSRADVPGHGITPLYRFASMGSALCFPIEAMVFLAITVSAIAQAKGTRITKRSISEILSNVRVYGDDIIVPVEYALVVARELEVFNLRVNTHKTFFTGKFRESCGLDAYDGRRITPIYLRKHIPESQTDASGILSLISFRNQCYENGLWRVCSLLDEWIGNFVPFPDVLETSSIVGRKTFLPLKLEGLRLSEFLHAPLVKGIVVKIKKRRSTIDDSFALLKWFLKRGRDPFADKEHLLYSGRPVRVYTKAQWATPF